MTKTDRDRLCFLTLVFLISGAMLAFTIYNSKPHCMTSPSYHTQFSDTECPPDIKEYCPVYGAVFESYYSKGFLKSICPWSPSAWISGVVGFSMMKIHLIFLILGIVYKKQEKMRRLKQISLCLIVITLLISVGLMVRDMVVGSKYDVKQNSKPNTQSLPSTHIANIVIMFVFIIGILGVNSEPKEANTEGYIQGNIARRSSAELSQFSTGPIVSVHFATSEEPPNIVLEEGRRYVVTVHQDDPLSESESEREHSGLF